MSIFAQTQRCMARPERRKGAFAGKDSHHREGRAPGAAARYAPPATLA